MRKPSLVRLTEEKKVRHQIKLCPRSAAELDEAAAFWIKRWK